ncbi:efflux RND transporter periplasmic adaptor subunit [Altererythrobacter sp. GH1-8]|uniref:efflux RND transporter periplasmic adaptor subunit n=1 Tax=Altererythrobacter sp. GH1-8 TaxID=3349333 RepID=UPI00374D15AE
MTRQAKISLGLIGAAILLAVLMVWLRPVAQERERAEVSPLVETILLEPASGRIPIVAIGNVEAIEEVTVSAQVSGRIDYINPAFREGGLVGRGALLLSIEQADYINRVRIAEADVAAQDVAVQQAMQEVAIARDEVERFNERRQAGTSGYRDDGGSQILPPSAPGAAPTPPSPTSGTINPLATREPQLRAAQAAKKRAEANLAEARLALARTRVTAPFSGIVGPQSAALGTLVQPGQALGSIASSDAFEVRVSLTPEEEALIPGGASSSKSRIPATVKVVRNGKTYQWGAYVHRVDAALDPQTRNVEVFLRIPNPLRGARRVAKGTENFASDRAPPLRLGSIVEAEIEGLSAERYAQIPARALRPGNVIWIVREGRLRILPVRVIYRTDETAFITSDALAENTRLVISNLTAPTDGQKVRHAGGANKPDGADK